MNKKILVIIILILLMLGLVIIYFLIGNSPQVSKIIQLPSEKTPSEKSNCYSSLSFSVIGNGTCNITASIYSKSCENKNYEIMGDSIKCSGTINSDEDVEACNWQVNPGNYTYSLYVDNNLKDSRNIICSENLVEGCACAKTHKACG